MAAEGARAPRSRTFVRLAVAVPRLNACGEDESPTIASGDIVGSERDRGGRPPSARSRRIREASPRCAPAPALGDFFEPERSPSSRPRPGVVFRSPPASAWWSPATPPPQRPRARRRAAAPGRCRAKYAGIGAPCLSNPARAAPAGSGSDRQGEECRLAAPRAPVPQG